MNRVISYTREDGNLLREMLKIKKRLDEGVRRSKKQDALDEAILRIGTESVIFYA